MIRNDIFKTDLMLNLYGPLEQVQGMLDRNAASPKKMGGGARSNIAGIICPPWFE